MRSYHSTRSVLGPGLPREPLLLGSARGQHGVPPREQGGARDGGDPRRVQVEHALTLEQDGHDPSRDLEVARDARRALGPGRPLLPAGRPRREDVRDGQRIDDHEALRALEHAREQIGNATDVGVRLAEIEQRRHRDLEPPAADPGADAHVRRRTVRNGKESPVRELREHPLDLGVPELLLVAAEGLARHGMVEGLALPVDRQLLTDLSPRGLAEVDEDALAIHRDHGAFERLRGLDEVVTHQAERRPDAIGEPGVRARGENEGGQHDGQGDEAGTAPQNVTDGWCTPNTARRRSQISPSVTDALTASTIRVMRFSVPRAPRSRASRLRQAASPATTARSPPRRSASALHTPASTWNS